MRSGAANPRGSGARLLAEGAGKGRRRATNRHCRGEGEKKGWRRGNARGELHSSIPVTYLTHPSTHHPSGNYQFVLYS
uniref:Uncharacterized protein n=1 Tax=Felis catus TaxID=9685 RepID=A0ABI8ASG9_FELCA